MEQLNWLIVKWAEELEKDVTSFYFKGVKFLFYLLEYLQGNFYKGLDVVNGKLYFIWKLSSYYNYPVVFIVIVVL